MEEWTKKWPGQVGVPKSSFKIRLSVPAGNLRRVGGLAVGPGGHWAGTGITYPLAFAGSYYTVY